MPLIHIGFDDTDSPKGGCTTYLCAVLVEKLSRFNVEFKDYPLLVRLNPNVPFRTRGNGCICLRLRVDEEDIEKVKSLVLEEVENFSDLSFSGTNPGVAYFVGQVPVKLRRFSEKALYDMISLEEARRVAEKCGVEVHAFKKGRGIIGALAAVGALLEDDSTY
ncbi:MAG: tRNA(Ile)(2)-agmatinylcytidine synthase, partial [Candidatus Freyarchaeota archaeon]